MLTISIVISLFLVIIFTNQTLAEKSMEFIYLIFIFLFLEASILLISPRQEVNIKVDIIEALQAKSFKDNNEIIEDMLKNNIFEATITYSFIPAKVKRYSVMSRSKQNHLLKRITLKIKY